MMEDGYLFNRKIATINDLLPEAIIICLGCLLIAHKESVQAIKPAALSLIGKVGFKQLG